MLILYKNARNVRFVLFTKTSTRCVHSLIVRNISFTLNVPNVGRNECCFVTFVLILLSPVNKKTSRLMGISQYVTVILPFITSSLWLTDPQSLLKGESWVRQTRRKIHDIDFSIKLPNSHRRQQELHSLAFKVFLIVVYFVFPIIWYRYHTQYPHVFTD